MTAIVKVVSPELQGLIDQANATFGKAKEIVERAYNLAVGEGFTPQEAKELLMEKITIFSKRTLYSYIPDEAKDKTKALNRSTKKPVAKLQQTNDEEHELTIKEKHEIIDADSETEPPSAVEQWKTQADAENGELAKLKEPFTVETTFDIKGVDIPVIVEVVPDKKKVFVRLDEAKARKVGL